MVCIMFGIGIDYCIFLMSWFKEEMGVGFNLWEVVYVMYCIVGKIVIYSGVVVFVVFILLYFV